MKLFWKRDREDREERHSTFGASSFSASSMALLMVAPTAPANADQAKITVSATVLKHASLKVLAQPPSVVITAEDVARGYVDVAAPAQVAVKSNSTEGYMLVVANRGDFLQQLRVRGLGGEVQMSSEGGFVRQPSGPAVTTVLDLGFRFDLSASAQPGVYPWPLQLSVRPI